MLVIPGRVRCQLLGMLQCLLQVGGQQLENADHAFVVFRKPRLFLQV